MTDLRKYLDRIPLAVLFFLLALSTLALCFSFCGGFLAAIGLASLPLRLLLASLLYLPVPVILVLSLFCGTGQEALASFLRALQSVTAVPYLYFLLCQLVGCFAMLFAGRSRIVTVYAASLVLWLITLCAAAASAIPVKKRAVPLPFSLGKTPFRIAVISDLHLGRFTSVRHLQKAIGRIEESRPDLILIPGDLADQSFSRLKHREKVSAALQKLRAPYGVYACEGNHDRAAWTEGAEQFFAACGFTFLRDEAILSDRFCLYGRRDGEERMCEEEIAAVIAAVNPENRPLIVLDHRPESIPALSAIGANAVFCGHTHGGQTFPGNLLYGMLSRYNRGKRVTGTTFSYTTVGCGRWGFPARLFVHDEVVIFEDGGAVQTH